MIDIKKAHWILKFVLNKIDSTNFTDIPPNTIDEALNKAQLTVIRNKLSGKKGLEFNRAITTDLAPIVKRNDIVTPVGSEIRLYPSNTTYKVLQYIRGDILAGNEGCDPKFISIIDREYDDKTYIRKAAQQSSSWLWNRAIGYFAKTSESNIDETSLYIETQGQFSVLEGRIDYLKYPREVCLGTYLDINNDEVDTSQFEFQDTMIYEIIYYAIFEIASILQYPDAKMKFEISQLTNLT